MSTSCRAMSHISYQAHCTGLTNRILSSSVLNTYTPIAHTGKAYHTFFYRYDTLSASSLASKLRCACMLQWHFLSPDLTFRTHSRTLHIPGHSRTFRRLFPDKIGQHHRTHSGQNRTHSGQDRTRSGQDHACPCPVSNRTLRIQHAV